jgi:ParB-like chromosome segregation protein Spo0J
MKKKVIEIDVERIRPNLRLIYHHETIEGLCRWIQSRGEVEPIQVWFDGECFRIWDGEKRWRVCKILGITRVKAFLVEFEEFSWEEI